MQWFSYEAVVFELSVSSTAPWLSAKLELQWFAFTELPFNSSPMCLYPLRGIDRMGVCSVEGWEQCKTCVRHAGSFLALTSVSATWGWWDIYRAAGRGGGVEAWGRAGPRPDAAHGEEGGRGRRAGGWGGPPPGPLRRGGGAVGGRGGWGGGPNETSKYFPSWFSVSSFLPNCASDSFCHDEKVLSAWAQAGDQPELETQTLKTSLLILMIKTFQLC